MVHATRIYLLGPTHYGTHTHPVYVQQAREAAATLIGWGFYPVCPHLTACYVVEALNTPLPSEDWWKSVREQELRSCAAAVLLPGARDLWNLEEHIQVARRLSLAVYANVEAFRLDKHRYGH